MSLLLKHSTLLMSSLPINALLCRHTRLKKNKSCYCLCAACVVVVVVVVVVFFFSSCRKEKRSEDVHDASLQKSGVDEDAQHTIASVNGLQNTNLPKP